MLKKVELWDFYKKKEREWAQKSKEKWVNNSYRNTKYFHALASLRRRKNYIKCIKGVNRIIEDIKEIKKEVACHFENLYREKKVLELVNFGGHLTKLKAELVTFLGKPFKEEKYGAPFKDVIGTKPRDRINTSLIF